MADEEGHVAASMDGGARGDESGAVAQSAVLAPFSDLYR